LTSERRVLPGAPTRLWRNRSLLLAAVLLAGLAPAVAGVTSQAQVRVVGVVDENWRGVYDILVRLPGARTLEEAEHNLVEPNFLTFTGSGGITVEQWEAVRELEGVEVAAPVAVVGFLETNAFQPLVFLDASVLPEQTTLYRLVARTWTTDGVTDRVLVEEEHFLVLPPPAPTGWHTFDGGPGYAGEEFDHAYLDVGRRTSGSRLGTRIMAPVVAVDPVAEAALLGISPGPFAPLAEMVVEGVERTVGGFAAERLLPGGYLSNLGIRQLQRRQENLDAAVVPLVVSERFYARLLASVEVFQVGDPVVIDPSDDASALDQAMAAAELPKEVTVGLAHGDYSDVLRPFVITPMVLQWPGAPVPDEPPASVFLPAEFVASLPGPLRYGSTEPRAGSDAVSLRLDTVGDGYRHLVEVEIARLEGAPDFESFPFLFGAVGTFDLGDVPLPDNPLSWAPLGAYEPPGSWFVAGPDGVGSAPVELSPTFDVTGLLQPPPLAYTDIEGARMLRGNAPIDAIRVRVAGLAGFDEAGRAKVETVATAIVELGLEVDVVAGSSPQPVDLYVPGYFEDGSDLGWVEQRWSTLGAAERVLTGLSRLNQQLLMLAVAVAGLVAGGLQLVGAAARTSQAGLLWVLGWSKGRIVWWLWAESVAAGMVVLGVGVVSWRWMGMDPAAVAAVGAVVALLIGFGLAGALWATGQRRRSIGRSRLWNRLVSWVRPDRAAGYSLRRLLARPAMASVTVASLAVGAAAVTVAAVAVVTATDLAGPTLLAGYGAVSLRGYQVAMVALAAIAGFGLFALTVRTERRHRTDEFEVLRSVGLPRPTLRRILTWQQGLVAAGAAPLAAALAQTLNPTGPYTGTTAALLALTTVAWAPRAARPVSRRAR
jgi:hypothetical protein